MNAAWGSISEADEISMRISANHKTTENVLVRKAFTVSMATVDTMVTCDYVGFVSGSGVPNKLEKPVPTPKRARLWMHPSFLNCP